MNVLLLLVICGTQQRSSHWDDERRAVCIHSTQCVCEQRRVSLYRTRVWYGALWLCKWGEYMGTMWPKYWRRILMSLIAGSRYLTSPHAVRLRISLQHRLWTICSRGSRRLTEPPQVQTHIMCHLFTVVTVRHRGTDCPALCELVLILRLFEEKNLKQKERFESDSLRLSVHLKYKKLSCSCLTLWSLSHKLSWIHLNAAHQLTAETSAIRG